jgi:NADH-quinone oxidoreductase subunit H
MWIKYTVPRIRIDHMMILNWKLLTPLALTTVVVVAFLDKLMVGVGASQVEYVLVMFAANLVIIWATLLLLRRYARTERQRVAEPKAIASPNIVGTTGT